MLFRQQKYKVRRSLSLQWHTFYEEDGQLSLNSKLLDGRRDEAHPKGEVF